MPDLDSETQRIFFEPYKMKKRTVFFKKKFFLRVKVVKWGRNNLLINFLRLQRLFMKRKKKIYKDTYLRYFNKFNEKKS